MDPEYGLRHARYNIKNVSIVSQRFLDKFCCILILDLISVHQNLWKGVLHFQQGNIAVLPIVYSYTDNQSLVDTLETTRVTSDRRLRVETRRIIVRKKIELYWIDGGDHAVDALTKRTSTVMLMEVLHSVILQRRAGMLVAYLFIYRMLEFGSLPLKNSANS